MKKLGILVLMLLALAIIPVATTRAIYIQVLDPTGTPVSGVGVSVLNGTTTIATGTTNGTGWVNLTVPTGAVVIVVSYNTTTDVVYAHTVSDPNEQVIIDMSTLPWVKLYSTMIKATVNVTETTTETNLSYMANETILYMSGEFNITYPKTVEEFPYKYTLKEIKYDGSSTTDNYVVISPTANMEITGVYEKTWWITLTTEQLILIVLGAVLLLLILFAIVRGGAKAILERRKYWV